MFPIDKYNNSRYNLRITVVKILEPKYRLGIKTSNNKSRKYNKVRQRIVSYYSRSRIFTLYLKDNKEDEINEYL